ncbi:MAG: NAD-dependent DNA ligase LigA, partial [Clostridiales bacterium]|nr:NAD-dependent DNA ligase LigA [Candidatus Apopatousia equi]
YSLDNPTISDAEWDKLYDELLNLEKTTGVILPDSPSQRVGGDTLSKFVKYTHKVPYYSLEKSNTYDRLKEWYEDIKKEVPDASFFVEYKYDGLTISITYKDGKLVNAATRGNGFVGEDVTEQVKTIRTVPLTIDYKGEVIVQGEGIMKLSELKKYNETALEPLKNARNAAAGAIRNLDPKITRERNLDVIFYSVNFIEDKKFLTQKEMHEFLRDNKFNTIKEFWIYDNFEDLKSRVEKIDKEKSNLDYLIDGAVIKLNNVKQREIFGFTSKFPKWAIAFKFEAQELSTKLVDVVWQVGRTGKLTPIGIIEPVELAGATVRKATLNNYGDILRKKVKIGSYVFVRRSNEVIPEILGIARECEGETEIKKPQYCPCCNEKLIEVGANLFCPNYYCPDQIEDRISHFASRDAMNIEGVSEKTAKLFRENLGVKSVADLYNLSREQLYSLEGFKDKKVDNYFDAIEKSKNVPLSKFIYALGILNIGKKASKDLVKHFKTLENIKNASIEDINSIYDFGLIMAQNVYDYFREPHNIELLERLKQAGLQIDEVNTKLNSEIFKNKTFVLTGTLPTLSREEATKIIEENGGQTSSSVSKNTSFILLGENPGSKYDKAQKLGIKTISEQQLLDMVK